VDASKTDSRETAWAPPLPKFVAGARTFLTTAIEERTAVAKKARCTADQAVADVTAELSGRYPDPLRLAWAVKAAYAERP
jgi:hypothetical protein